MAITPSNMLALGIKAPDFQLPDVTSQKTLTLSDVKGQRGTIIMFICHHCPYVVHVQDEIASISKDYGSREIGFVAVSSNDVVNYPTDSPEYMKAQAEKVGFDFPYLYDESQQVAKDYDAACTPDFYLFDKNLELVYRGRLDESRPNSGIPVSGKDLRGAIDRLLNGEAPLETQYPSIGCNIKWKS